MNRLLTAIDTVLDAAGALASLLLIALAGVLAYNVVARYAFDASSIALEELAWHFYSAVFLFGLSYALKTASHVRVDLLFEGLDPKAKARIDLAGCLVFLLPLCLVVVVSGWQFAVDSWSYGPRPDGVLSTVQQILGEGVGEKSQDPGGLTNRWLIKAVIPVSFLLLLLAGVGHALRQFQVLRDADQGEDAGVAS
ncbi:MAG: TRAP transporter small permease subunit [Pseudomonadota bacterium]